MQSVDDIFKQLPKLYVREVQLKLEPQCSICLNDFNYNQKVKLLGCGHYYHTECIKQWLTKERKCPYCQSPFTLNREQFKKSLERRKKLVNSCAESWFDDLKEKPLSELKYLDLRFLLLYKYGVQFTGELLNDEIIHILSERDKK